MLGSAWRPHQVHCHTSPRRRYGSMGSETWGSHMNDNITSNSAPVPNLAEIRSDQVRSLDLEVCHVLRLSLPIILALGLQLSPWAALGSGSRLDARVLWYLVPISATPRFARQGPPISAIICFVPVIKAGYKNPTYP